MAATTVFAKQVVSTLSKYGETYLLPYVNSLEQEARSLVKTYNPTLVSEYDAVLKTGDSLSKNFPLMNPFHVALILVGYLVIVFGGKFLMSFKKNPFSPKLLQIVHNALLVAVSAFMTFETINQWYP
jgi:hypothetical protein